MTHAATLYDDDFYAWTQNQAERLRARAHNEIDWDNTAEEIESVGASEKRAIGNNLARVIDHMLKWHFQPEQRKYGWYASIQEHRQRIASSIEDSPSLKHHPAIAFERSWKLGSLWAAKDMGQARNRLPTEPPYSLDEVMDEKFLPGPEGDPAELTD